jgi:hypothetical protein
LSRGERGSEAATDKERARQRDQLFEVLRDGLHARPEVDARGLLGLSAQEDDLAVARTLIDAVARTDLERLVAAEEPVEASPARESAAYVPVEVTDASFLGRLKAVSDDGSGQSVAEMTDVTTLLSVLRAGSLLQRRAAAKRLALRL